MAKFNYARSQSTALRLIDKFGRTLQIKQALNQTGSVTNPGARYGDPVDITAAVLPYTEERDNRVMALDNASADQYRTLLIAAQGLDIEPKADDVVSFDTREWAVVTSTPLKPADITVMHTAVVRRI